MSRIDTLISALCPEGVAFRNLGDVIQLNFGSRITKMNNTGSLYPVYGGGGESFRTNEFNRENQYVVSRFAMSEKCVRKVSGKFWMLDSGFTVDTIGPTLNKDYLGYLLFNLQPKIYACSSQGAQKNLKTEEFRKFRVPVPPLEVQHAIVTILDTFTDLETKLEAALEAELEARRRQYQYYREALLSLESRMRGATGQSSVKWAAMGEVGRFTRGRRFTKDDYVPHGIECIHYGDIYTQYGTSASKSVSHVRADMVSALRFATPGDVIIAAVGETVEDVGKAVAWLGSDEVAVHDDCLVFRHSMNPKFVAYYFQTRAFHAEKSKFVARAKVKRLSGESLAKLAIPVPPLDEQVYIVGILDQFDALVKELAIGLPAELTARRRQYAYYRDHLLSFREAA